MSDDADPLQRLWSPWRMAYVRGDKPVADGCPLCVLPGRGAERDAESLIVHRGEQGYVILNAFPYNPGHCMVVPYRHVGGIDDLDPSELGELAALTQQTVRALRKASEADAFNIGLNMGEPAGAGIADHVHQHVVPRWAGDTNFMPVVGRTRVLPELLEETYERLSPIFAGA